MYHEKAKPGKKNDITESKKGENFINTNASK